MSQPSLFSYFKKLNNNDTNKPKASEASADSPKSKQPSNLVKKEAFNKEDKENNPTPAKKVKNDEKAAEKTVEKVVKVEADSSKMDVDLYDNEDDDVREYVFIINQNIDINNMLFLILGGDFQAIRWCGFNESKCQTKANHLSRF